MSTEAVSSDRPSDSPHLRNLVARCWQAAGHKMPGALQRSATPSLSEGRSEPQAAAQSVISLALQPVIERFGELAALSLVINMLSLAVPIFVLQVYDRVVFHGGPATLSGLIIGVIIALGFDFILRQARSRLVQMIALRVDIGLIRALFEKLTNLPLRRLESRGDSEWHRLLRDQECVRDTLAGPTTILMVDLPFVLLFIGVIWLVAQPIAWLLVALTPVYIAVAALSSWVVARASRREEEGTDSRQMLTSQLVQGRLVSKALGLGGAFRQQWESTQASLIEGSLERGSKVDIFTNLSTILAMATTVVMTSVGALSIVHGSLTIGGLIAANMLAARVVQPLVQMIGVWRTVARLRDAVQHLDKLLDEPTDRQVSALAHERPRGVIRLENVDFAYEPGAASVLRGINITLRPGGLHGIVGLNGSGKTTLLNIVKGLYTPDRGRVLIDGADIRQFGRDDLSRWIGYVPQDTFLFAGSVRDNIGKLADDLDDAAILAAARQAYADSFISDLPDGYATEVGEGGARFSAGQRQRIALARALIGDPPILLLDEPNAHLDQEATVHLRAHLQRLARERNVILVTHSRTLLAACSTVIVLETGAIAVAGPGPDIVDRLFAKQSVDEAA